jgi:hypothetical protein
MKELVALREVSVVRVISNSDFVITDDPSVPLNPGAFVDNSDDIFVDN